MAPSGRLAYHVKPGREYRGAGCDLIHLGSVFRIARVTSRFSYSHHSTGHFCCTIRIKQFTVFGTGYETNEGTAVRDYVHVCDLADAHVKALVHLLGAGQSASVNLGSGKGYFVRQVISAVEAVSGRRVPVVHAARRAGDLPN
jgi:nucleoside-diphosphate-sugar epimerase